MTAQQRRLRVEGWQQVARQTKETAQLAYTAGHWRSAVSRAYYAAYQAATAVCVAHGDEEQFPQGWNNPTHEQLPELIQNNGDISFTARRQITQRLVALRISRESADYRPGRTVDGVIALESLQRMISLLKILGDEL